MNKANSFYKEPWYLILGILFLSFNLRPSITAVGPLVPMIRDEFSFSNAWAGFLTTLPLLTFASFSLFSSAIGAKLGNARAIFLGLFILGIGTVVRVSGGPFWLFFGTGLTGIGIVICNVLIIPFVKTQLPKKIGLVTAVFTTGMTFLAAVASGISAPMAIDLGWGWRGSLLFWIGLLLLGLLIWLPQVTVKPITRQIETPKVNVWKSRLAWDVSLFMGIQSLMFFTLIAWLPDMMMARGLSAVEAGILMSVMQLIGLVGSFLSPIIAVKYKDQKGIVTVLGVLYLIGFTTLFFEWLWLNFMGLALVGLSLGSSISLAYTVIGLRTLEERTTASLSGMSQSMGYFLAALGPLCFGLAFDIFGLWKFLIYLMLISTVLFLYFGWRSAKAIQI